MIVSDKENQKNKSSKVVSLKLWRPLWELMKIMHVWVFFCVVQSETLGLCILPSFLGDSSDARHSEGITVL